MNLELNHKINFYVTGLLALFIPIHDKIPPILTGLLILNWLFLPSNVLKSFKALKLSYTLLSLVSLFFLYFVGVLLSENMKIGFKSLETILPFMVFPIIYGAYKNEIKKHIQQYLNLFILGCVCYAFLCFGYAAYAYFKPVYIDLYENGTLFNMGGNYFFYSYLSIFFHPSYTAMFSVFALIIIVVSLIKETYKLNWKIIGVIVLLTTFILLLSSKAGWLSLIGLILYLIYHFIKSKKIFQILYFLVPIIAFFMLFNIYYTPNFSKRIPETEKLITAIKGEDENKKKVTTFKQDGNASRVFIWKASLEVFAENWLGIGTGDAKLKLLEKYRDKQMTSEYENKLNSHNQYLTTSIALGVFGLLVFMFVLLYPLFTSLQNQHTILVGFILLVALNFLFESMLETQKGVAFFAFFYTLICVSHTEKEHSI